MAKISYDIDPLAKRIYIYSIEPFSISQSLLKSIAKLVGDPDAKVTTVYHNNDVTKSNFPTWFSEGWKYVACFKYDNVVYEKVKRKMSRTHTKYGRIEYSYKVNYHNDTFYVYTKSQVDEDTLRQLATTVLASNRVGITPKTIEIKYSNKKTSFRMGAHQYRYGWKYMSYFSFVRALPQPPLENTIKATSTVESVVVTSSEVKHLISLLQDALGAKSISITVNFE
jgi:hypothetical protein